MSKVCLEVSLVAVSKVSVCDVGDLGSIPGLGRSPGGGHGNPLQHSCLENPMDRGACSDYTSTTKLCLVNAWLSVAYKR